MNGHCPFCHTTGFVPDVDQHLQHWKICSAATRSASRVDQKTLPIYHAAYNDLNQQAALFPIPREKLAAPAMKVLRMWRANEFVGRDDYLAQLESLPKRAYDLEFTEVAVRLMELVLLRHGSSLQTVIAIEDFFGGTGDHPYTAFYDSGGPHPILSDMADDEQQHISSLTNVKATLEAITTHFAMDFPATYDPATYPLAISMTILVSQIYAHNVQIAQGGEQGDTEWDENQDGVVLSLLQEGLPMVEVARRLNAEIADLERSIVPGSLDAVTERVQVLLEWA